ncbi:lactoylglutathione lyase (plasmid) [Pararhizobium polonicum]|uniref:Lactoylglutathione lyase n=1 Tax=Pararhizobium polonicum TaxID=1612624 RepID=A0A1C7PCY5_9HYPH|nr:VOC family protein [Pararhizobium polonicum]OBZ97604.1 lactoylglutathione lyase [Pararhizobium polonicum]
MIKGLTGIGHAAIRVKDIDVSLDFYCNKLGFQEMLRLHRDNGDLWLVYLRINDLQYLEVFPYAVGDAAPPREAIGLNHICITVDNVDEVVRQLAEQNIPLIQPLVSGADGNRQAWIADPDGNRYELMQMNADCMQYEAIKRLKETNAA